MIDSLITFARLVNYGILFALNFIASMGIPGALFWTVSLGALADSYGELIAIIIIATLGAILGDIVAYEAARKFSAPMSAWLVRFGFYRNHQQRVRASFKKSEFALIFLSRFLLTAISPAVSFISGFEKVDRKKYLSAVVAGEAISGTIYPVVGYVFRETWNDVANLFVDIVSIIVLVIIVAVLIRHFRSERRHKEDPPQPF